MIDRSLNYGRKHIHQFSQKALANKSSAIVLDIGAGKGDDLLLAKCANQNANLHAIECYPPNIEILKQNHIETYGLNIERDTLPFATESVDLVISNQVFEHTKEVFWICHEISRVLKVNGHFLLGIPNLASFHNRILLAMGRQPSPIKTASAHVRGFTKPDVLHFMQSCFPDGYKLVDFAGSNFYPFPPAIAKPLAAMWATGAWGIFFLFEKQKSYDGNSFLEFPVKEQLETNFYIGK